MRHAELPVDALLDLAALLVANERDRPAREPPDTGDDRPVVRPTAVAVQLDPVGEHALDVVERVRPVGVTSELDVFPDLLLGRGRLVAQRAKLSLQPLLLAGDLRPAQERQARQPA